MGWRFRKSIKIMPGVRINLSKSGISTSVGPRGAKVTFGPNGTYVNAGIPGTGLYTREKISGGNRRGTTAGNYSSAYYNASDNPGIIPHPDILSIKGESIGLPCFKNSFYISFLISFVLPFVGLTLYCISGWWMFFSCLLADFIQLMLWAFLLDDVAGSAYEDIWIVKGFESYAKRELMGHKLRQCLASAVALANLLPLFAMNKDFMALFTSTKPYEGGTVVFLMTIIMTGLWLGIVSQENRMAKNLKPYILPSYRAADGKRNTVEKLNFAGITIGTSLSRSNMGKWNLADECGDYQVYTMPKKIVVKGVEQDCSCSIYCLNGNIGFLELVSDNKPKELYELYVTKYGEPREKKVKDFYKPFVRSWNYQNQRIVFQYNEYRLMDDNLEGKTFYQVRINYIDNRIYQEIKDFCESREKKELEEKDIERKKEMQKAEKEREEQKRIIEANESAQRLKESEQI